MEFNFESDPDTDRWEDEAPVQVGPATAVQTRAVPDTDEGEPVEATLEAVLEAETVDKVTIRYVGTKEFLQPKGFGKFYPDTDYEMSAKCAKFLIGLKQANGTPAFETV